MSYDPELKKTLQNMIFKDIDCLVKQNQEQTKKITDAFDIFMDCESEYQEELKQTNKEYNERTKKEVL